MAFGTTPLPADRPADTWAGPILAAALLAGAALRFWSLGFGLPNTDVRPDETAVVGIALGLLFAGLNPRFFHWPSLMFYAVAAVYRVWFEIGHWRGLFHLKFDVYKDAHADPAMYVLIPRVMAAAAGTLTIFLVYRVTRELFDRFTGAVAAALVAVAFLHVRDSHFGVTDVPMTLLAVATMVPLVRASRAPSRHRHWMTAGLLAGLTASTKYNGGLIALVGLAVAAIAALDGGTDRRVLAGGVARFIAASIVAFFAGTPFALLDAGAFVEGLRFDAHHLMDGHGIALGRGWAYHPTFSLWYGMGVPLLFASIVGMGSVVARSWRTAVIVLTFPILYYLAVGRGYTVFVRYITPIVPFLCITAAVAIVQTAAMISSRVLRAGPKTGPYDGRELATAAVAAALALAVSVPSISRSIAFDRLLGQRDTRLLAAEWLDARVQPGEWIQETPPAILHPEFGRAPGVQVSTFDRDRQAFVSATGEIVTPAWIALARSPLGVYNAVPPELYALVSADYTLEAVFAGASGAEAPGWFDQQDLFFVPMADFSMRERPGPDIRIYRRRK